jgi:hypothetical protein
MIVRIMSRGKSFSGLATNLTHDADRAKTAERVAWTHTHNLANDDIPCAVNEMLWTARDAELLKQEAGIRAGGRATENAVKHLSLNWAPDQHPTREHMIQTAEGFLRHMGWQEHQAIFVAHQDKHPHVHIVLNVIHPETGLRLDDDFDRRRAQTWALEYERANGHVYCAERLKNTAEREKAPPRNIWMAFHDAEREFENAEKIQRKNDAIIFDGVKNRKNSEWDILKEIQRIERAEHFNSGKSEFKELRNSVYWEVREEFRERWSQYYAAKKARTDSETLAEKKGKLVADQKAVLETKRNKACIELKVGRNQRYRELLDEQGAVRGELRWRQQLGLDNAAFLTDAGNLNAGEAITRGFREAANEVARAPTGGEYRTTAKTDASPLGNDRSAEHGRDGDHVGFRLGFSIGSLFESIASHLLNGGSPPAAPPRPSKDLFRVAADDTVKREQRDREEAEAEERRKQRSAYWE